MCYKVHTTPASLFKKDFSLAFEKTCFQKSITMTLTTLLRQLQDTSAWYWLITSLLINMCVVAINKIQDCHQMIAVKCKTIDFIFLAD